MAEHYRRNLEAAEARVAELEKEKLRLEVRIADLQAQRDYWEEKCAALEGWDDE